MKGNIKAYSTAMNAGVIVGEDGRKYKFSDMHWLGIQKPEADETVFFDNMGTNAANVRKQQTA